MTIDKVIQYHNEVADEQSRLYSLCPCPCDGTKNCMSLKNGKDMGCTKCAAEHRQLAEWLTELKELRDTVAELCEAKRLLKAAVEDMNNGGCNSNCYKCKHCGACDYSERFTWKHTDEALKLLGGSENGT